MGRASRSKAETLVREVRIKDRCENLYDGLLDQAVQHVWDAELAFAAIGFGNRLATYRRGPIRSLDQLLLDFGPMLSEPGRECGEGHAVGPWGSTVGLHFLPCVFEIGFVDDCRHQRRLKLAQGWLLSVRCRGISLSGWWICGLVASIRW